MFPPDIFEILSSSICLNSFLNKNITPPIRLIAMPTPKYNKERANAFSWPRALPKKYTNPLSRIPKPFKDGSMLTVAIIGKISNKNIKETGAEILVSSCQQCERTLSTALKKKKGEIDYRIKVMDVSELVLQSMLSESAM